MLIILDTSNKLNAGTYSFFDTNLSTAKELVRNGFRSAIDNKIVAQAISVLLSVDCPVNEKKYRLNVGDVGLVFDLFSQPMIITKDEINRTGYSWSIIRRLY